MKQNFLPSPIFRLRHLALVLAVFTFTGVAQATTWNGIEPLKSTRADVERALGQPVKEDAAGAPDALRFNVAGGTVVVFFVDKKFVANKKLDPALEGTVLQIILQHKTATDTPETLKLKGKSEFIKESGGNTTTYRNLKDGVYYTFVENRLRTTRYSPSAEELKKATTK